jgi:hypothetical protein
MGFYKKFIHKENIKSAYENNGYDGLYSLINEADAIITNDNFSSYIVDNIDNKELIEEFIKESLN